MPKNGLEIIHYSLPSYSNVSLAHEMHIQHLGG